jgi:peptide deformylase
MAILPIVRFPDPRLRAVAEPVEHFDADLRRLADDLLDTMRAAPGVGITAPHVGLLRRLVVLELSPGEVRVYVNPKLVWSSPETARATEGSVSMPGVTEEVERPAKVRVTYQDLDGTERTEEADGFLAICHQHEIDQLDGIFWLQRLSRLKRGRVVARYGKLQPS